MVWSSSDGVGVGDNSGVSSFPGLKESSLPSPKSFAEESVYTGALAVLSVSVVSEVLSAL